MHAQQQSKVNPVMKTYVSLSSHQTRFEPRLQEEKEWEL